MKLRKFHEVFFIDLFSWIVYYNDAPIGITGVFTEEFDEETANIEQISIEEVEYGQRDA